jgi:DsbC/DsbD-like thiol-disulfide interchange protein
MANRNARTASAAGLMILALVVDAGFVSAQGTATARHTKVSLVAETDAVQAGSPLTVGIRLQMEPGWHTYWRNPGDSGLPTRAKWTLPAGFEAGELGWPYPERFASGPLVSYGYAHEALLPAQIRVPGALEGREVRLGARVEWLECQEVCLPGKTEVSLTMPVRAGGPGPEAAAFAEARKRLPAADPAWRFAATPAGDALALAFSPPRRSILKNAYFYASTPRVLDYARPQTLERTKTGYRLLLARDPNGATLARLAGVLVIEVDGRPRAYEVDVAL